MGKGTVERCWLCNDVATNDKGGTPYYRFYSKFSGRWESQPICTGCLFSLKGPVEPIRVYPEGIPSDEKMGPE